MHNKVTRHTYTRFTFYVNLVNNEFSSNYVAYRFIIMTKSALVSITINSNRKGTPVSFQVVTAPAKEFKMVNNSISRVIRVMIDKPDDSI